MNAIEALLQAMKESAASRGSSNEVKRDHLVRAAAILAESEKPKA